MGLVTIALTAGGIGQSAGWNWLDLFQKQTGVVGIPLRAGTISPKEFLLERAGSIRIPPGVDRIGLNCFGR